MPNVQGRRRHEAVKNAHGRVYGALKEVANAEDVILRWGANEYLVALPRAGVSQAQTFADRACAIVNKPGSALHIHAGVTELQGNEDLHLSLARAGNELRRNTQLDRSTQPDARPLRPL